MQAIWVAVQMVMTSVGTVLLPQTAAIGSSFPMNLLCPVSLEEHHDLATAQCDYLVMACRRPSMTHAGSLLQSDCAWYQAGTPGQLC